MHSIISFEVIDPENIGEFMVAFEMNFVAFLFVGFEELVCFEFLCRELLDEGQVFEVIDHAFKNIIVGDVFLEREKQVTQLTM